MKLIAIINLYTYMYHIFRKRWLFSATTTYIFEICHFDMKLIHNLQLLLLYSIESSFHCCNAQMNDHIFSNIANPAEKNDYCCNFKHITSSQAGVFVCGRRDVNFLNGSCAIIANNTMILVLNNTILTNWNPFKTE